MSHKASGWRADVEPFLRLLGYFLLLAVLLLAAISLFPSLRQMLVMDTAGVASAGSRFKEAVQESERVRLGLGPAGHTALVALLAMLGGLLFALPVAWTYIATKRHEGYDKSVVQMVIMLPIAVSGVVLVVFNDIALAFALAGIVAAVRFRTTLKDVKDAVFAFVAIGIGLASGVLSWALAGLLSLIFCTVVLALWRFEVGEANPDVARGSGPMTLSEALTAGDGEKAVAIGDPSLVAPLSDTEFERVKQQAARLQHHVRADALREKQKYRHLLLVHASDAEEAEDWVEECLERYAKRWRLVEVLEGRGDTQVLEYLVRLNKAADLGEMLERIQGDEDSTVRAVELKSMKGLRDVLS